MTCTRLRVSEQDAFDAVTAAKERGVRMEATRCAECEAFHMDWRPGLATAMEIDRAIAVEDFTDLMRHFVPGATTAQVADVLDAMGWEFVGELREAKP